MTTESRRADALSHGIAEGADGAAVDVLAEIATERRRQVEVEGWTERHDDEHGNGELARAAAAYADHAGRFGDAESLDMVYATKAPNPLWPWHRQWWKPKNPRRDLIRAGALIVAEIERLDRRARGGSSDAE